MGTRENRDALVEAFATAAVEHHKALVNGDAARAVEEQAKMVASFGELRAMGDEGYQALASLLQHDDEVVNTAAATVLLRYATDTSIRVLERVATNNQKLLGFRAEQALARWQEGNWHLDED